MKKIISKKLADFIHKRERKWIENPHKAQENTLKKLVKKAENTSFGQQHNFSEINNHSDFIKNVPVRNYEQLRPWIDKVVEGSLNVLWNNKPKFFAKTSGTTSGSKYIPITNDSMPYHIKSARNALLNYIKIKGNSDFVNGKMIFLQGSPVLEDVNGVKTGRLSGISAHYVPKYLQKNRMPCWETNCIEDWEIKVNKIVEETINENMTLIGGIPPWLIMYFEKLEEKSGQKVYELFPNLQLIVTGGVNYEPYREKMNSFIGKNVDVIQTYPASEGFIAYQNELDKEELLLLLNNDIFYEFIPLDEIGKENPKRLSIKDVQLNENYALVMTTNAGLWSYLIGDTVQFTSIKPYKIIVSGRIKHYTSAFGEHVIAGEVENALKNTLEEISASITEFHVAPQVNPKSGLPYHEWLIEFDKLPSDIEAFSEKLDQELQQQNAYYKDLIEGKVLRSLVVTLVPKDGFKNYMKSQGKLGGQNKVPRLANDRKLADKLLNIINR